MNDPGVVSGLHKFMNEIAVESLIMNFWHSTNVTRLLATTMGFITAIKDGRQLIDT